MVHDPRRGERRHQNEPGVTPERRRAQRGARVHNINWRQRLKGYFNHHKAVAVDAFRRMISAPVASAMTWSVIAIALALPAGLYLFLQNIEQLGAGWERSPQISVYLQQQISDTRGQALADELVQQAEIDRTHYISPEQSLIDFKARSGLGDALQYLQSNPLPGVIEVYLPAAPANNTAGLGVSLELLMTQLEALPEVDQVRMDMAWLQRLQALMVLGQRISQALGLVLGLAVLLVTANTVRMAVEARREEIRVVKLVGGTDAFIRRPFLYTGLWYGLGGGVLAWLLLVLSWFWFKGALAHLLILYGEQLNLQGVGLSVTLSLWLIGALLGFVGAWIAVSRHIRAMDLEYMS